jgi:hypothetical protein
MNAQKIFAFLVLFYSATPAQNVHNIVFQDGEQLNYKVKWGFIRLGSITFTTSADTQYSNPDLYRITMDVRSSSGLPFIDIEEINQALVNESTGNSLQYYGRYRDGSDLHEINCFYDASNREATYSLQDVTAEKCLKFTILRNVQPYFDGPSLFFYTRSSSRKNHVISLPTMIDGVIQKTRLEFTGDIEYIEVDAWPEPVRTRKYIGFAEWEGGTSAGLSGQFEGWISDDDSSVLLRAEVAVFLGSLNIELESYHRKGWVPPEDDYQNTYSKGEF